MGQFEDLIASLHRKYQWAMRERVRTETKMIEFGTHALKVKVQELVGEMTGLKKAIDLAEKMRNDNEFTFKGDE